MYVNTLCIQQKCDESALFVQQIDVANEIKFRSRYMMFVYHCNNPECHVRMRFDREPSRIPVKKIGKLSSDTCFCPRKYLKWFICFLKLTSVVRYFDKLGCV